MGWQHSVHRRQCPPIRWAFAPIIVIDGKQQTRRLAQPGVGPPAAAPDDSDVPAFERGIEWIYVIYVAF